MNYVSLQWREITITTAKRNLQTIEQVTLKRNVINIHVRKPHVLMRYHSYHKGMLHCITSCLYHRVVMYQGSTTGFIYI